MSVAAEYTMPPRRDHDIDARSDPLYTESGAVGDQLRRWHAHKGDKSFARAMIPTFKRHRTPVNVFKVLRGMPLLSWLYMFSGWFAWTVDGYDFFAVSVTVTRLAEQFHTTTKHITLAITLTLLLRGVGAIIFGSLADRFGRKWTLVGNLLLVAIMEMCSGFCNTYSQFLGVRAVFGLGMGGVWGQAAAISLENIPYQARGLASGWFQQGYTCGYLLVAVINLAVVPKTRHTWRAAYWIGAGFSIAAAAFSAALPESPQFREARRLSRQNQVSLWQSNKTYAAEIGQMLRTNWLRCIWAVSIMTGFNYFSHGSQDLYPTYLQQFKHLSAFETAQATIISNVGAAVGGTISGYMSQFVGRRLQIILAVCYTACWIPLWILPDSFGGLSAGGFFLQSGVQAAWSVVPIYLAEVAPPAFRATFTGTAYQLGNMASAGAAQIEADGEGNIKVLYHGKQVGDLATVMSILTGVVAFWILLMTLLGPEADDARFERALVATQEGAGLQNPVELVEDEEGEKSELDRPVQARFGAPRSDSKAFEGQETRQAVPVMHQAPELGFGAPLQRHQNA